MIANSHFLLVTGAQVACLKTKASQRTEKKSGLNSKTDFLTNFWKDTISPLSVPMKAPRKWGEGAAKDREFKEPRLLLANVRLGTSGELQNFLGEK